MTSWIWNPRPRPMARLRLVCFPYAGSGPSAYLPWVRLLPGEVELRAVSPPGCELRAVEPPETDLSQYASAVADALVADAGVPFALFGHSLGAIAAYETAQRLVAAGRPPVHLFLSAKGVPQASDDVAALCALDDAALLTAARERYGGPPAELEEDPELLASVLLRLRSDLALLSGVGDMLRPSLAIAVSVLWSPEDASTPETAVRRWDARFSGPVRYRAFPGGHFYLNPQAAMVVRDICAALDLPTGTAG